MSLCGWQRQLNGPTVQGHVEGALADLLGHPTPVIGASRTDAGVHARGQVCAFWTARTIPVHGIQRALNGRLPPQIAIVAADEVADDFHPRFSARGKHYRYTILTRDERSPRLRDRAWHLHHALDLPAMRRASTSLIGEHDFAAFRAAGCSARTTVRRIFAIEVTTLEPDLVVVDVRGNAFLRNMVRIVVGTLAEVGTGARPDAQVAEILASLDRTTGGVTAPAHGLELVEVFYGNPADHV